MISYKTKLLLTALAFLAFMGLSCSKPPVVESATEAVVEPVTASELQTDDKMHINENAWNAFYETFRGKYHGEHQLRDDLNEQAFEALMKSGADINVRNEDGQTLLMATQEVSVIEALIAAGIDVNARDREGRTALMYAASDGGQYCDDEEELEHIACKAGTGPCDNEEDYHCEDVYAEDVLIAALEACKDEDGFNCELNKWKNLDTTIEQLAWNVCSEEDCDLSDVLKLLKP